MKLLQLHNRHNKIGTNIYSVMLCFGCDQHQNHKKVLKFLNTMEVFRGERGEDQEI